MDDATTGNGGNGQTPLTGSTDIGPMTINWKIYGDGYSDADVSLTESGQVVAQSTMTRNSANWDTGEHSISNGTVDASFKLAVPAGEQNGQLTLVDMTWTQDGSKNSESGIDLQNWDASGTPSS